MTATTATAPVTIVLGDAVQARFLRNRDAILRDGLLLTVVGTPDVTGDRVYFWTATTDGYTIPVSYGREEFVPLATAI